MRRPGWNLMRMMAAGGIVPLLIISGSAVTESASDDPSLYQSSGSSSPNIIGYQPISNDVLGSGSGMSRSQDKEESGQRGSSKEDRSDKPEQSELPSTYITGILGDGPYTLGRDDVIRIDVRNQPEFSGNFQIGFDGRIQYNYVGDIPLAGLTKYEVQQVVEKLLERYIRVPVVNVFILAYNSKVVYVIGEVGRPGKFIMRGDAIKLREAILAAGLPTHDAALRRVHIIKPDLYKPRVRVVNVKKILYKGQLKDDVDLYPGEIVVVPSTVLAKINDFLGTLLNPTTRARSAAALAGYGF